jgi:diketogulonate reductase-like aldo/keto reductase
MSDAASTTAQVRLAWTLQQGPHVLVIPGTGNLDHLAQNVTAGALHLSDDEMTRLSPPARDTDTKPRNTKAKIH